mmetsp:Transcript_11679/g.31452  ORF Transcript_11679/g.31452 Transcript_11679/m.31452 type:complete len:317 (+) Transcript_11679:85-1035(+)
MEAEAQNLVGLESRNVTQVVWDCYEYLALAPREHGALVAAAFWAAHLVVAMVLSQILSSTYRSLSVAKKADWLSRVNSTVHAVLSAAVALYVLFFERDLYAKRGFSSQNLLNGSLTLTLGYFICDAVIVIAFFKTIGSSPETLAHHALAGCTAVYAMSSRGSIFAQLWVAGTYFTEMSTPMVNLRWFVSLRYRNAPWYTAVGILMMVSFFITRLVFFPAFMVWLFTFDSEEGYTLPDSKYECVFMGNWGGAATLAITLLNMYWFYLMVKGAMKIFFPKKGASADSKTAVGTTATNGKGAEDSLDSDSVASGEKKAQ